MSEYPDNIYPVFDKTLQRQEREKLLNQRSQVVWITGLSGSGKSTIGIAVERALFDLGFLAKVIDGDNIRSGISNNLSFEDKDRYENIRRIAEVNKLFLHCGVITINCFISPTNEIRKIARDIIGDEDFVEVYVDTTLEVCERRDVKGLYKKARKGELKNFTGVNAPFEIPNNADILVDTNDSVVEHAVKKIMDYILPRIKY